MFLCDNCPTFIRNTEKIYACNVMPSCVCAVYGERVKPVMICPGKTRYMEMGKENDR